MVTMAALPWMAAHAHCRALALMLLRFLLASLLATVLVAQPEKYEGRRITSIDGVPDDNILAPQELEKALSTLKVGDPLSMANVRSTIQRLYATGRYENIEVDAQNTPDGVSLIIKGSPTRFIRNVFVTGVEEPPSRGQLVNATKLQLGEEFTDAQARQSVENLLEVLRSNGFYLAKVTPTITQAPAQQVDITFTADTGDRAKYTEPTIKGTPNKAPDDIIGATRWKRLFGLLGWKEMSETRTQQGIDRVR